MVGMCACVGVCAMQLCPIQHVVLARQLRLLHLPIPEQPVRLGPVQYIHCESGVVRHICVCGCLSARTQWELWACARVCVFAQCSSAFCPACSLCPRASLSSSCLIQRSEFELTDPRSIPLLACMGAGHGTPDSIEKCTIESPQDPDSQLEVPEVLDLLFRESGSSWIPLKNVRRPIRGFFTDLRIPLVSRSEVPPRR